jgi:N-acetylglucosaminyldiphosphoundecaprenol N-acetyl-beta-D-mannosaminyltransferase
MVMRNTGGQPIIFHDHLTFKARKNFPFARRQFTETAAMPENQISGPAVERVNVLGVGISVLNLARAAEVMTQAIAGQKKGYIAVTGVHGVTEAQDHPDFRAILNSAFLCTPDGMPMVWMGKLAGHKSMSRVYGPDLMELICEQSAARGWKHFFYGGAEGVAEQLQQKLCARLPALRVVGTFTPPFRALNEEEEKHLAALVSKTQPDFFWVGLSTPKQERFMAAYLPKLDAKLMIGVGAAFDFHAGRVRQAPRWIQRSGFEWAYRISQDPKRLWKRYARNNPLFVARVFLQKTGLRRYSLEEP